MVDNPDEDRRKVKWTIREDFKLLDLSYTRGIYDVVAVVDKCRYNDIIEIIDDRAIAELIILEDIDLNAIAKKGSQMIGL